jgi:hypothetical protein
VSRVWAPLALVAMGVAAIAICRTIPDDRFRGISKARLWFDRRTVKRLREGTVSEEEWLEESTRVWRRVFRHDALIFGVFLIAVGGALAVRALVS